MQRLTPFRLWLAIILLTTLGLLAAWPVLAAAPPSSGSAALQQSTPTRPGPSFGPIVGSDYTPVPLQTALPPDIAPLPCYATVAAPDVPLHPYPGLESERTGTAANGDRFQLTSVVRDNAGNTWGETSSGWLQLSAGELVTATLDRVRACEQLWNSAPLTTLAGLHVLNWHTDAEVITFVERMALAGFPVGTVKGLNGTQNLLREIKEKSPHTITVYRSVVYDGVIADCPNEMRDEPDPADLARTWFEGLERYWKDVDADYFEYINECPGSYAWHAQFAIEAMKIAEEQGRCLLLFSMGVGSPELDDFDDLLPAYEYALQNPCASGRLHGISLHTYSLQNDLPVSEADSWLGLRHRMVFDRLRKVLPAGTQVPVFITETGIGWGSVQPACELVARDAVQYTHLLENDPYVKGFHLWSVGPSHQWYDIAPCLPTLADALIGYYRRGATS